jgi:hypothetical protein
MSKKNKQPETPVENVEAAPTPSRGVNLWIAGPVAAVLLVGVFAGGVALRQHKPRAPIHIAPDVQAASKPEPAPWTYDSVTNQHWDPEHKHWHSGHPPNQSPGAAARKPAPNIPNPAPWQYDAASDQHFNPEAGHGHWHNGKPPADKAAAPAPEAAPAATTDPVATTEPAPAPIVVEEASEAPAASTPAPEPVAAP